MFAGTGGSGTHSGVGAITWELLRRLATVRPRLGPAVSVYLDLDPRTAPTWSDVESRAASLLSRISAERDRLQHEERASLDEDVERLQRYLQRGLDREGTHGLALFASANAGLWEEVRLPRTVPSRVSIDRELYLAPLVPLVHLGEPALVAVVNRRRGSLYRLVNGSVEELADLSDDDVPTRHDQGGWSQANYQRHVDALARRHLVEVAQELDRRFRLEGRPPVVLVCPEEERSEVEGELPGELAAAVVGWTSVEAHAPASVVARAVRPLLDRRRTAQDDDAAARWQAERSAGKGARGWSEVLPAASDGRVEELLYIATTKATAFRCTACGRGVPDDEPCPLDGAAVEPADAVNLALLRTLANGGTAQALEGSEHLGGETVCAILRW
jgi:peptide chain release factor subunit 1